MKTINLSAVTQGIQRLREKGSADPGSLYDLENGYVAIDGSLRQRPGTELAYDLPAGTIGYCVHNGDHVVFSTAPKACPAGVRCEVITHPYFPSQGLTYIWFAAPFLGYLYVAAEFENGDVYHYWLQASNEWEASTTYMEGQIIVPSTPNGLGYKAHRVLPRYPNWIPGMEVVLGTKVEPTTANGYYYDATATSEASGVGTPGGSPNPDPPGDPPTDGGPDPVDGYAPTFVGGPSDGYVGEYMVDSLGPLHSPPFQAYGGLTEERFIGDIVGNVTCQSAFPGAGVVVGIPLTAETRNAATEMIVTGPLSSGGPYLITDSVTIAAKPTYSMMDEMKPLGDKVLVTLVTTPARTTKQLTSIGLGGLKSRAGTSTDKVRCAFTVSDMPADGKLYVGVLAAGEDSHLAPGANGSYAHLVTADGIYVVELNGATGDVEVFLVGTGSVATGTLPATYAYDGKYRFAWSANDAVHPCPGATVHTNMGNESWPDTPTAGFGGLLNAATVVPCGFDATVGTANGYWLQGTTSLTEATNGGISGSSLVYAYSAFGKSSGKWRIGMRGTTTGRLGFCKTSHTGLLGATGTADSIGFTDTRSALGYIIETSFGGVHATTTIPQGYYYSNPLVYFAFDHTAHTLEIYVKFEIVAGDPSAVYTLLHTVTGIPSGTWLPALNGAGQLVPEIPAPATYDDWTVTL